MGSFIGHVFPGSFFVLFSLWHILQILIRYFKSKQPNAVPFRSSTYFVSSCGCSVPVESLLKIVATTICIIGDAITGYENYKFVYWGNLQHITMYAFFGFTGLVETLHHYNFNLPPNLTYVSNILAFVIEGLLFYFHLHGREAMDVQVHLLLIYVIALTAITLFVEMSHRGGVLPPLIRSYLILLQGVWLWQVAFILYPPAGMAAWDLVNHEQMMIVTVIFCMHAFLCLVFVCAVWFLVAARHRMCRRRRSNDDGKARYRSLLPMMNGGGGMNGEAARPADMKEMLLAVETDEEEETELFKK